MLRARLAAREGVDCHGRWTDLSGWGRYPKLSGCAERPEARPSLARSVGTSPTVVARGLGRAYGDAAANPRGTTVLMNRLDRMLAFDPDSGVLRAEAGLALKTVLDTLVPRGWFPPVTPGTKFVTLGGMVACDVHGKNHHRDGSFGRYVRALRVLISDGSEVHCSRDENAELFWATIGGMGLTGVITEVEFSMRSVESALIRETQQRARDLSELLELVKSSEEAHTYSVAWIDCLQRGRHFGRGVVFSGEHASREEAVGRPEARRRSVTVPITAPSYAVNGLSMRAFNELYYRLPGRTAQDHLIGYDPFFYPLDGVEGWNRLYGSRGFLQYQCVVPSQEALVELLRRCAARQSGFLGVLKRLGQGAGGLSFPAPGHTLALDFPIRDGLLDFLDELDAVVVQDGGRVYLAKDSRLAAGTVRSMYPDLERWQAVKRRHDPEGRFSSSLSRRLELD